MSLLRRRLIPFGDDRASVPGRRDVEHFLVTSWGHAGSIWLAGSLNLHDAVCATAGIDNPIESFRSYRLYRDPVYVAGHAGVELSRHGFSSWNSQDMAEVRSLLEPRGVRGARRDPARLPSYVFDELDLVPAETPYLVLGNVHGLTLGQLHAAVAAEPDLFKGRRVVLADLVRHPVGRTESAIKATMNRHLGQLEPRIAAFLDEHARECADLERRYRIDFSEPRARSALHVFRQGLQNDVWAFDLRTFPDVHRILFERLQADPEYFAHVFGTLAQGRVAADPAYLDRVFAPENLASGRQSPADPGRPAGPRAQYELWSPFERDEFGRVARRLRLGALYFPFGYDLTFVSREGRDESWFSDVLDAESAPD